MNGDIGAPIFVKISEYKGVANTLDMIKSKLASVRSNLIKINEIKANEDSELKEWESSLDNVEKKVEEINKALFEQRS